MISTAYLSNLFIFSFGTSGVWVWNGDKRCGGYSLSCEWNGVQFQNQVRWRIWSWYTLNLCPWMSSFNPAMSLLELRTEKYAERIFAFSWSCICFVFCFGFFETSAILAALLVKKFHVLFLFACFTVRSVGARITKVYLPAAIMKAQWLCGMLSLDQRPDLFRYPLPVLRIWDKNAFPPPAL